MTKLLLLLLCASFNLTAKNLPEKITINKESGISIRQTVDPESDALGAVYHSYSYRVTDGKKSYVKVKTNNGIIGWAWVGADNERFEYSNNKVRSIVNYNIPVKNGDVEGLIQPNESVELLQVWHSRLKVKTPDNKHGWIYAGKYDDPWVKFENFTHDDDIYVDLLNDNIHTNGIVNTSYVDYSSEKKSHKFVSSEESELSLEYEINDLPNGGVLEINHMVANKNKSNTAISILINGIIFVENFKPVYNEFKTDVFHIGHLLKNGKNKITILLERANSPYFIQSLTINH